VIIGWRIDDLTLPFSVGRASNLSENEQEGRTSHQVGMDGACYRL